MKIKDKLDSVYKTNHYKFCEIDFELYPDKDCIRIYDKIDGNILYEDIISNYPKNYPGIRDLIEQEPAKEELRKYCDNDSNIINKNPYVVCFYLGKPKEIVEGPISVKMNYGG